MKYDSIFLDVLSWCSDGVESYAIPLLSSKSFIDIDIQDSTNDIEKPVVILTKDTNWYMLN